MSNPTVCAIMLVNGRPEMVARAVRSFREQTYPDKLLFIWDTGVQRAVDLDEKDNEMAAWCPGENGATVGTLRNSAIAEATASNRWSAKPEYPELLIHWDSDDWSHPRRIEEQVALLQSSGKEAVGYRDLLFWQEHCDSCELGHSPLIEYDEPGSWHGTALGPRRCSREAWLYTNGNTNFCLGTSLCYWRRVWERRPFEDLPKGPTGEGEDHRWLREVDSLGVSIVPGREGRDLHMPLREDEQPRMIASVHGGNTSSMVELAIRRSASELKRAPQWDEYCRERMAL